MRYSMIDVAPGVLVWQEDYAGWTAGKPSLKFFRRPIYAHRLMNRSVPNILDLSRLLNISPTITIHYD